MAENSNQRRRKKRLNVPVDKDEKQQVREDAAHAGYSSMSEYIRHELGLIEDEVVPA